MTVESSAQVTLLRVSIAHRCTGRTSSQAVLQGTWESCRGDQVRTSASRVAARNAMSGQTDDIEALSAGDEDGM
jgi:hypothetical protein